MVDDAKGAVVPFNGANPASAPSAPVGGEQGQQTPPSITRADLEELEKRVTATARDTATREAQRLVDKTGDRFEKRVNEISKVLEGSFKAAGIPVPEGVKIRDMAMAKAIEEGASPASADPSGAPPPVPAPPAPAPAAPIGLEQPGKQQSDATAWAEDLENLMGVKLEEGDEEIELVKNKGTVQEYEDTYALALRTKIARVASGASALNGNAQRSPGVLPPGTTPSAISSINDPAELLRLHREKTRRGG